MEERHGYQAPAIEEREDVRDPLIGTNSGPRG